MASDDAKRELELQSLITQHILIQTKAKREAAGYVKEAQDEYDRNLALLEKQNAEIEKYDRSIRVARTSTNDTYRASSQGAADATSGLAKLHTGVKIFNDEMFAAAQRLNDLSEERRALTQEIAASIGGSSRLFNVMATDAKSATDMIDAASRNATDKLKGYYETLGHVAGDAVGSLREEQLKFISDVNATDSAFLNTQVSIDKFYRSATGFKEGQDGKLVPDSFFMVQGVPIRDIMGSTQKAFEPFLNILKDETLQQPFAKKMLSPESMDESLKELKRIDVAIVGLGINSRDVTETIRLNYIRTGEATTDYFNEVVKAGEIAQNAFGYNSQMIVGDVLKMSQNIEVFGMRGADEFAKIAARVKDLHMNVNDLQGAMGKFDTFESAAQTVGQLNSALGTNFDALELMTLKFEDPAMMIERLREGLMSAGKSFDDMPIAYRRMITQQLGITMEGLRGLMDGNVRSLDEMTQQQEDARSELEKGLTSEQQQRALDARLESRVKLNEGMVRSAQDITALSERAAKVFAQNGVAVSEMAERSTDGLHRLAREYTETAAPAIKELLNTLTKADDIFTTASTKFGVKTIDSGRIEQSVKEAAELFAREVSEQLEKIIKVTFDLSDQEAKDLASGKTAVKTMPEAEDVIMKGSLDKEGARILYGNYGQFGGRVAIPVDERDTVAAVSSEALESRTPTTSPPPSPAPPARPPVPAFTDAVRASLTGVGTSLRIELDVGQLTELVLRDIMMNKPNVFGGIG